VESPHSLLKRQLKRFFGSATPPPLGWESFVHAVNDAYLQFDSDRAMLERAMDLSSQELLQGNSRMRVIFERIIQSTADGIFAFDRDCRYTVWNPGMERISGVTSDRVIGKSVFEVFPSIKESGEDGLIYEALKGESIVAKGAPQSMAKGTVSGFFESYYSPLLNDRAEITGGLAIIRDVTEHKRAEGLLMAEKSVLETIAKGAPLSQVLDVLVRVIEDQSKGALCSVLLIDQCEKVLRVAAAPNLPQTYVNAIEGLPIDPDQGSGRGDLYRMEPLVTADLSANPFKNRYEQTILGHGLKSCWSIPIFASNGEALGTVAIHYRTPREPSLYELQLIEISSHLAGIAIQRREAEESLAEQAIRDTLTQLYNRRYFDDRMGAEIARANRLNSPLALLLCDLDRFKDVNDTHGHQTGDKILKEVANRIQASVRGSDIVFRWGGDEIVVILPETSRDVVLVVADRIRAGIRKISGENRLNLDLSIGVAIYPEHAGSIDELIRLADRALYIAKKGGDKVHIGEEEYDLSENSIKVVFQPIFDIRSGAIFGYEALSRDPSGKLGILQLFQRYQAIGKLGDLKRICFRSQLKRAGELGLERVFVNIDFDLFKQIDDAPSPDRCGVILEISELEAIHDVENRIKMTRGWR